MVRGQGALEAVPRLEDTPLFRDGFAFERAVWLQRRDLSRRRCRTCARSRPGQWIGGIGARRAPRYDYGRIAANAGAIRAQNAAWTRFFAERFRRPVLPLVYEDLLSGPEAGFAALAAFLDPAAPPLGFAPGTERESYAESEAWCCRFAAEAREADRWI